MEIIGYNYFNFPITDAIFSVDDVAWTTQIPDMNGKREKAELAITFSDGSMEQFTPKQFHLHAPSEHSVDGKLYDAEIHLVHVYKGVQPEAYGAVIGIFFDRKEGGTEENAFLKSLFDSVEAKNDQSPDTLVDAQLNDFVKYVDMTRYWSYDGSFTTPPCTEGIKWTVIQQVQSISEEQLKKITGRLAGDSSFAEGKGNNRIVQDHFERTLFYTGEV